MRTLKAMCWNRTFLRTRGLFILAALFLSMGCGSSDKEEGPLSDALETGDGTAESPSFLDALGEDEDGSFSQDEDIQKEDALDARGTGEVESEDVLPGADEGNEGDGSLGQDADTTEEEAICVQEDFSVNVGFPLLTEESFIYTSIYEEDGKKTTLILSMDGLKEGESIPLDCDLGACLTISHRCADGLQDCEGVYSVFQGDLVITSSFLEGMGRSLSGKIENAVLAKEGDPMALWCFSDYSFTAFLMD